jgi:hypothetical protein
MSDFHTHEWKLNNDKCTAVPVYKTDCDLWSPRTSTYNQKDINVLYRTKVRKIHKSECNLWKKKLSPITDIFSQKVTVSIGATSSVEYQTYKYKMDIVDYKLMKYIKKST